jgi:protein-tyrosine phosphatase
VKLLFVCTGNICRSPAADGVMRKLVERAGLEGRVLVDSAGVSAYHAGEAPDSRTQQSARKRGYDLSDLQARAVVKRDFQEFDLILAMDVEHETALLAACPPDLRQRVRRFLDFAPEAGRQGVPDPYYGGPQGFEDVLDMIEAGCRGLLAHVQSHLER